LQGGNTYHKFGRAKGKKGRQKAKRMEVGSDRRKDMGAWVGFEKSTLLNRGGKKGSLPPMRGGGRKA